MHNVITFFSKLVNDSLTSSNKDDDDMILLIVIDDHGSNNFLCNVDTSDMLT